MLEVRVPRVRASALALSSGGMRTVPQPSASLTPYANGVGKIFVQFADITAARKFQATNNGRKFDDRVMCAAFYPTDR